MLVAGKTLNGIAVALIALTAGGEIKVDWVRKQIRRLAFITGSQLVIGLLGFTLVVMLARPFIPFMPQDSFMEGLVVAFVFGAIAVASSPTVTIAVIAETRADGPMSRTVIGVTILKDVCVIVLFAIALAIARDVLGDGGGESLVWSLTRELGGSVLAGLGVGLAVSWFLEKINRDVPVFTLAVCFGISQAASALHLEALLIALTAGFYVENFAKVDGHRLIAGVERVSLPVFALFFALAGAKVNVGKLIEFGPIALALIVTRAGLIYVGTRVGTNLAQVEPVVKRLAWTGFISQAGVTLALSAIVARTFPKWGADAEVLIIAMIAVHELVGPVLFHHGLKKADEVGKAVDGGANEAVADRNTEEAELARQAVG
jgi:Kef-type K+ transport system membrane component KefB